MSGPYGDAASLGFRNCVLFALDANGWPLASSATAMYEGVRITGLRSFTITDPTPRVIPLLGDDYVMDLDSLPPNEAMGAELHVGKYSAVVDALLSGQKTFDMGDLIMFGEGTDLRGFEPQVGVLAYAQSKDLYNASLKYGARTWVSRILPKATLYARATGFQDTQTDQIYTVVPSKVGQHLWGVAFTAATEGFTLAQMIRGLSYNKPKIGAWKADGTVTSFSFPAAYPAVSATTIKCWVNGVLAPNSATTSAITPTTKPSANDVVVTLYQTA